MLVVTDNQTNIKLPEHIAEAVSKSPKIVLPKTREGIINLALGGEENDFFEVSYEVPGKGNVTEAEVVRCKNGVSVNYIDPYMRRRDPNCMLIADEQPTDKETYESRFGSKFSELKGDILEWISHQELIMVPFMAGQPELGYDAVLIAPKNAGFFAGALADLQGMIPSDQIPSNFEPRAVMIVAPPFRHTHCDGRQVVVHERGDDIHEIYALNLYPGPSAKKGVYGLLITIGEKEEWVTAHGSTVQVITPYDNIVTIMHEGASGGGKSEMLQYPHRDMAGRLLLGENLLTGEKRYVNINQNCFLRPVTDDMALCHPSLEHEEGEKRLVVKDAEQAWFVRVNHIDSYGVDPYIERLCTTPPEPLLFLNIDGAKDSTCLIWEHIEDEPGKPCPNPRVVLPRSVIPDIVDESVPVDIRSFGVRTPPCTRRKPTYGILGVMHITPPALAWLWRMVSPRGHGNPSITDSKALTSEGVGSYWPFATGRRVDQANLLLSQILKTPDTNFVLIPNQHIGCWETGFMPQWLAREYLARRGGAKFRPEQLVPARCPLLGYAMKHMAIEGNNLAHWFLEVDTQPEVGTEGYDQGAERLYNFFRQELDLFYKESDLHPKAREIIGACFDKASVEDYQNMI